MIVNATRRSAARLFWNPISNARADRRQDLGVGHALLLQARGERAEVQELSEPCGDEKRGESDARKQQADVSGGPLHRRLR